MSNVISFLETMGSNSALARLSAAEYVATVAGLNASEEERETLMARDHSALSKLLGGRAKMLCSVFSPSEEEPQREQDEPVQDSPPESE